MDREYRKFPVIQTNPQEYVPWGMLTAHEKRAIENHAQSLETLARRGGLNWSEILAVLEDRPWGSIRYDEMRNREAVMRYVSAYMEEDSTDE